jgi:hypothetical protein
VRQILISFALLLVITELSGQNVNHFGFFPTVDHSGRISDKWSYGLYYFNAFNAVNDKFERKTDRPGYFVFYAEQSLSYQISKNVSLTGSYVYERQNPTKRNYRNENRLYFQGTYKPKIGATELKFRARYDARFIQDRETRNRPYTSRVRALIGVSNPIGKSSRYYVTAYNEMFFNTYKGASVIYGENWAYAGVGMKTTKLGTFEAGPLYIAWVTNEKRDLLNFYYLQLSWITNLDFRKNK